MSKTKKVFGWAGDLGGCYFYRLQMPLGRLAEVEGWDVGHGTRFPNFPKVRPEDPRLGELVERIAGSYDVVIAQRTCQPAATLFFDLLSRTTTKRVYEIDDDLFSLDQKSNPEGHEFYSIPEIQRNIKHCMTEADCVTVSTPKLAEIAGAFNSNVLLCPNAVPDWLVDLERKPAPDPSRVTIGWGGSQTHLMDFAEVVDPLRQLFRRRTDIDFHSIGANYLSGKIPRDRLFLSGWCPNVEDYYRIVDFDIAIAPLRPHRFNQAKSYIKALEYAALGIPVVASDVGPYRDFVEHGVTGFLVKRPHEWNKYLAQLIEEPGTRLEMGFAARRKAADYTITKLLPNWKEALS
jgi:hypothetical protein